MPTNAAALIVTPPAGSTNHLDQLDIRGIRPPVPLPNGWAWLGWSLAVVALAGLGWWAWRRWRARATAPVPEVVIPPHIRARERLRAALALLADPERFCVEVSNTLRVYLEERFEFHAPERTTEEFLEELQGSPVLSLKQKRSLADFLLRCDLVKFARYQPGEPELRELYDAAVNLVEETEPSPAPAGAPPAAAVGAAPASLP